MTTYTDEQLMVSLVEDGSLESFEELLNRYEKQVLLYIIRLIADYHRAQDLCQETFHLIYKNRASFNSHLRFSTWAYRIATNLCLNELKSKTHTAEILLEDVELTKRSSHPSDSHSISNLSPEEKLIKKDVEEKIRGLVKALPEKLRSIFVLSEYQGLSNQDIANILDIPIGTVKSRLHQSFKQLFKLIEKRGLTNELH
jgi:RNA polymerase sigma-70 factor (ECF subfamily)